METLPFLIHPGLSDLITDLPADIFGKAFRDACQRLDHFVGALLSETALILGLPARIPTLDSYLADRGWSRDAGLSLRCLLEALEEFGLASFSADGWVLRVGPPAVPSSELRLNAEALLPTTRPSFEVMTLTCGALPDLLAGKVRGEDVLFGPATLTLWFDYFSNDNPLYGPSNHLAAQAVARVFRSGGTILEAGGGAGSAALAVLQALGKLGKRPARYTFTELQPAFLRRGTRNVKANVPQGCEVCAKSLDINVDPSVQGITDEHDVVFAVNTVHLAQDLVPTLARLRSLVAPGGHLVIGELVRPWPRPGVHLELPFTLLEAYRNVSVGDGVRSRPGFMTLGEWRTALERAGFSSVSVLPAQIERCVERYPGFYGGAITAAA
jgi:SAM-dependent methyltransferase